MDITEEALQAALSRVIEPDLKKDIVELDLVQEVVIDENTISIIVEVSNPAMHSRNAFNCRCRLPFRHRDLSFHTCDFEDG